MTVLRSQVTVLAIASHGTCDRKQVSVLAIAMEQRGPLLGPYWGHYGVIMDNYGVIMGCIWAVYPLQTNPFGPRLNQNLPTDRPEVLAKYGVCQKSGVAVHDPNQGPPPPPPYWGLIGALLGHYWGCWGLVGSCLMAF